MSRPRARRRSQSRRRTTTRLGCCHRMKNHIHLEVGHTMSHHRGPRMMSLRRDCRSCCLRVARLVIS